MANITEFYIPMRLKKKAIPQSESQKGKIIKFCAPGKKSAIMPFRMWSCLVLWRIKRVRSCG